MLCWVLLNLAQMLSFCFTASERPNIPVYTKHSNTHQAVLSMKEVTFLVQSKRDNKLAVNCSTEESILTSGRLDAIFFPPYFIWGINLQYMLN